MGRAWRGVGWAIGRAVLAGVGLAASSPTWAEPEDEPWSVWFSGVEIGGTTFAGGGFKRSLTAPLGSTGFVLLGTAGAGQYRDREIRKSGLTQVDYMSTQGSLLGGYQWTTELGLWAVMVGAEADLRQPIVNGTVLSRASPPLFGARLQAEAWIHPTDNTLVTGTLVAGTARPHLWARATWAYRVWQTIHVGPETTLSLEPNFAEGRIGLHVSGLRFRSYHIRLSGGALFQASGETGVYATLGTYFHL